MRFLCVFIFHFVSNFYINFACIFVIFFCPRVSPVRPNLKFDSIWMLWPHILIKRETTYSKSTLYRINVHIDWTLRQVPHETCFCFSLLFHCCYFCSGSVLQFRYLCITAPSIIHMFITCFRLWKLKISYLFGWKIESNENKTKTPGRISDRTCDWRHSNFNWIKSTE